MTEPTSPRASVLIPVLDEERDITATLAAVTSQTIADLEFIFADGGSRDRTREILAEQAAIDPRIRLLDNPRRTVTSGLNVALAHARGRWVVRMDAHSVFPADYVERGIARLRTGGTCWVSGPAVPVGRNRISRAVARALGGGLGQAGSRKWRRADEEWELDTGLFCGVWERATLLEIGGWDERWRVNEDSEMAARLLDRGERLVAIGAMAAHYMPRDSLIGLWSQYRGYGAFRTRTAVRHPASLRPQHLVAPALVVTAAAASAGPRRTRRAARALMATYVGVLGLSGRRAAARGAGAADATLVAVVLATMHFSFGIGVLDGIRRFGMPWRAVVRLSGLRRIDGADDEPVFAPSLTSVLGGAPAPPPT